MFLFCLAEEEEFKATATASALSTARPSGGGAPTTATVCQSEPRGGRGGAASGRGGVAVVRGGGGVGRGVIRGLVQIQEPRVQVAPIQISDDSSETSDDSEEGEVDYSGFGRCFRCGELGSDHPLPSYIYISHSGEPGHWVRNCPY